MAKIKAFNTGRKYTVKGQRIAYTILSTGNIAMVDIDRGIDYVLQVSSTKPVTDNTVLGLYDNMKEALWNEVEYHEFKAVQNDLYKAADLNV